MLRNIPQIFKQYCQAMYVPVRLYLNKVCFFHRFSPTFLRVRRMVTCKKMFFFNMYTLRSQSFLSRIAGFHVLPLKNGGHVLLARSKTCKQAALCLEVFGRC